MLTLMKAVVLLSGGLDSATCLALAREAGMTPHALFVNYGQRNVNEEASARAVAASQGVRSFKVVRADLAAIGGSALTGAGALPRGTEVWREGPVPATYVPARNTVLFALALGYAEAIGADSLYMGVNSVDYSGYPDCRPQFVAALQALAPVATRCGVEGAPIRIQAPLLYMSKPEIITTGLSLGVDYSLTMSCYEPVEGIPCHGCEACQIRARAFANLGMPDPALVTAVSPTCARRSQKTHT
jgi:7-cyano-7-deazaguanine synthase